MSDYIITAENISKKYVIGHNTHSGYKTIRDVAIGNIKKFVSKSGNILKGKAVISGDEFEEFEALSDINFRIKRGEAVGIIGRNGAGKSTLLKVLSRITEPSSGKLTIRGRISSLLEVGTGFHPELTGRENIFLNGSILGMSRAEIKLKFDEIVEFSGVDRFLDTPVKRYSSGMYVRLAFSVAAHLEPEILVVDEVLAVGDAEFQKKCLGKMQDVSQGQGKTVLFVSHNINAIKSLCTSGIFLQSGKLMLHDTINAVLEEYSTKGAQIISNVYPIENDDIVIDKCFISQERSIDTYKFDGAKPINLKAEFQIKKNNLTHFRIGWFIKNQYGDIISRYLNTDWDSEHSDLEKGKYTVNTEIPMNFLTAGTYFIELHTSRFGIIDYLTDQKTSIVIDIDAPMNFNPKYPNENSFGILMWKGPFTIDKS